MPSTPRFNEGDKLVSTSSFHKDEVLIFIMAIPPNEDANAAFNKKRGVNTKYFPGPSVDNERYIVKKTRVDKNGRKRWDYCIINPWTVKPLENNNDDIANGNIATKNDVGDKESGVSIKFIQKMVRINIDEFAKDRDRNHLNEIRRLISLL